MDHEKWAYMGDDPGIEEAATEATAAAHHNTDDAVVEGAADGEVEDDDAEPDDHADSFEGTEPDTTRWMMAAVRNEQTDGRFMVGVRIGPEGDDHGVLMVPEQAIRTAREMVICAQACEMGNALIEAFSIGGLTDEGAEPQSDDPFTLDDETRAKLNMIAQMMTGSGPLQD